jgi:hypothetical protein
MAEDDGHANRPALRIMILMDVAPADANATNPKQNFVFAYLGHW